MKLLAVSIEIVIFAMKYSFDWWEGIGATDKWIVIDYWGMLPHDLRFLSGEAIVAFVS